MDIVAFNKALRLSLDDFFQDANMAARLPPNIGSTANQSVSDRQSLPTIHHEKIWMIGSMRAYQELIMRVLVFCFPRNSLKWFTDVISKLTSDQIHLAHLRQIPGIQQDTIAQDWMAVLARHFLSGPLVLRDLWMIAQPAVEWIIPRLSVRARKGCRSQPLPPPQRPIDFVHSRLKNNQPHIPDGSRTIDEANEWIFIRFTPRVSNKWHILPTPETARKLNKIHHKNLKNLHILLWKEAIQCLKSPEWNPVYLPFSRGNGGFYILRKHLDLFAIIGDKKWGTDVWGLIEAFTTDCHWFQPRAEDGLGFERLRSRRQFMAAAYDALVNNYFFGTWLDTLGLFQEKIREHLAGSHMECLWFVTLEDSTDKNTLPDANAWLKIAIFFILERLVDLFADIVGWKTPVFRSIAMGKRSLNDLSLAPAIMKNPVRTSSNSPANILASGLTQGASNPSKKRKGPQNQVLPVNSRASSTSRLGSSRSSTCQNRSKNKKRRSQRQAGRHPSNANASLNALVPISQPAFSPDSPPVVESPKPSPFLSSTFSPSVSQDLSPGSSAMVRVSSELHASFSFRSSLNSFESLSSMKSIRDALDEVRNDDQATEADAPGAIDN